MNDPRPKTDQPKDQTTPRVVLDPTPTAAPVKPMVTGPQPKRPDAGGNQPRVADPKPPAPVSTQAKP
jgi:hypothetical protein